MYGFGYRIFQHSTFILPSLLHVGVYFICLLINDLPIKQHKFTCYWIHKKICVYFRYPFYSSIMTSSSYFYLWLKIYHYQDILFFIWQKQYSPKHKYITDDWFMPTEIKMRMIWVLGALDDKTVYVINTNASCGGSPEDKVKVYAFVGGSPYNKVKYYAPMGGSPRYYV